MVKIRLPWGFEPDGGARVACDRVNCAATVRPTMGELWNKVGQRWEWAFVLWLGDGRNVAHAAHDAAPRASTPGVLMEEEGGGNND